MGDKERPHLLEPDLPDLSPPLLFLLAVALISAAALGLEVILMRLFSIVQWYHFAYMIISLALLGYGASGTLISLLAGLARRYFPLLFVFSAALFGITALTLFPAVQQMAFNPLELLWDPQQWLRLIGVYSLMLLPFLLASNCTCLALLKFKNHVGWIYGLDLLGAGLGAVGVIGLLQWFFPLTVLAILGGLALLSAAFAWVSLNARPRIGAAICLLTAIALPGLIARSELKLSPYKALSQTLEVKGARLIDQRSGPLGWLAMVANDEIPFRYAPGLSLNATVEPPSQLGVFVDGDSMTPITHFNGDWSKHAYLGQMPSALAYRLLKNPRVVVLGAGGGMDVLQALYHKAAKVDVVELDDNLVDLVGDIYADFSGHLYQQPQVKVAIHEARGFMAASKHKYDLIQVGLLDAFNTAAAGLHALNETYLYTVEAFELFLDHLNADGILSITRWVRVPPRENLKLFATAVEALENAGYSNPGQQLVWIRSWNTATLLVKQSPFSAADIARVRDFCQRWGFDVAYYPGMPQDEANRFHRLAQPYFHQAATALLGPQRQDFIRDYKFHIEPATDNQPYFFHAFKWSSFSELMKLRGRGGVALIDLGYLLLVGTVLQLAVLSGVLIIVPLLPRGIGAGSRGRVLGYFFAVGIGFMFVEIVFIQKLILYLSHPLYAVAVVLTGFLIFAAMGSMAIKRFQSRYPQLSPAVPVVGILAVALLDLGFIPWLTTFSISAPEWLRIGIALLLIAPLAFCMGMPFPLALTHLNRTAPDLMPWAWAVNGCASVTGAVLASLLAIHWGLMTVIIIALVAYGLAGWVLFRR